MTGPGKILTFPDRSPVEEEAARWVVRLSDNPSQQDRQSFEAWRSASPLHADAYARLAEHWTDLDALSLMAERDDPTPVWRRAALWGGLATAAAAVVAAVFLGVAPTAPPSTAPQLAGQEGLGVYKTAVGAQQRLTLEDGTIVTLNTDSRIEARMNSAERTVRLLEGEAFFQVAHDANRPFRVYAGDGVTVAVGTAFSVRLEESAVKVVVSEGKVAYSRVAGLPKPEPIAYVTAGEAATFGDSVTIDRVATADIDRQLSWTEGRLEFSGETLSSVVADISRYTDMQFEFATQDLADMRVGGVFGLGEVDSMLQALEANFGVRVERLDGNRVRISRNDP